MRKIILSLIVILFSSVWGFAQGIDNYIIRYDIGDFKFRPKPTKEIYGNSGVLILVDHFDEDHDDISYVTRYIKPEPILGVDVQVTKHAGSDSDRWLLHELDMEFRTYYGIPGDEYAVVPINGNTILEFGSAGWDYRWVSGNKVIVISYHDSQMTKPEPLEVVRAYLAKHPSSIMHFTLQELRSTANITKWIKDEMERRLWLCDKWSMQLQLGKVSQQDTLEALGKHMKVFLNYRQKYYGVKATDDITALSTALQANDGTAIRNKLAEYRSWWSINKGRSISI